MTPSPASHIRFKRLTALLLAAVTGASSLLAQEPKAKQKSAETKSAADRCSNHHRNGELSIT